MGELEWLHEPLTALAVCSRPLHVLAANTRGDLGLFDLRNKSEFSAGIAASSLPSSLSVRPVQKYRGFAGSVRAIAAHPTAPLVASVSVDRFLVLHDLDSRQATRKVRAPLFVHHCSLQIYCKAKLNAVLLPDHNALTRPPKEEPDEQPALTALQPAEDDEEEPAAVADFFRD